MHAFLEGIVEFGDALLCADTFDDDSVLDGVL